MRIQKIYIWSKKVLRLLYEKFNFIMISIKKSKDLDQINIDELKDSFQAHETCSQ